MRTTLTYTIPGTQFGKQICTIKMYLLHVTAVTWKLEQSHSLVGPWQMCIEIGGQAATDGVHVSQVRACVETAGSRRANLVSVTSSCLVKIPLDVENMWPGFSMRDASNHPKALHCRAPPPPQKLPTSPYVEQKTHSPVCDMFVLPPLSR